MAVTRLDVFAATRLEPAGDLLSGGVDTKPMSAAAAIRKMGPMTPGTIA